MVTSYLEVRKQSARGTDSIAADVMRHLHTRQHLGKAIIVCSQPQDLIGPMRKQWLKLSRNLQKQRSSTVNADKILKYTHSIAHMQHLHFTTKSPLEQPDADIYFLPAHSLGVIPIHCWTAYILDPINPKQGEMVLVQMPQEALIVTYQDTDAWPKKLRLPSKRILEDEVNKQWGQVRRFIADKKINIDLLINSDLPNVEAMDDALDTLLGVSHKFLQVANEFQRTLELARPLRTTKEMRNTYDAVILLAHRVQALTPGVFNQSFLEVYKEDDTFFLQDKKAAKAWAYTESLAEAFARHTAAGRINLAQSLRLIAAG